MAWKEVWVTAAEDDAAAKDAARLAKSLRRTSTGKKILVVPGLKVSTSMRKSLEEEFDAVLPLDLRVGMEELPVEFDEKVKIALHGIRLFQRGVFISSSVFVLQNVDFIFDALFSDSHVDQIDGESETTEMNLNCPLFAVIPSKSNFSFMTSRFVSNQSTSLPEFEAVQSKATQIFASFGVAVPSTSTTDDIDELIGNERTRLVMFPKKTSANDDNGFLHRGQLELTQAMLAAQEEEPPQREESSSVPLERMAEEPIAIVGMACRLPASNDVDEFWNLIINNGDGITKVPEWRWLEEQVKEVTAEAREMKAGFLKCPVDEFDAKFFGMNPKEMEFTDPQQRLLLEVSWEALEDAAIDATSLHGTQTGIFTGTWTRDYGDLMIRTEFTKSEFFRSYIGNSIGATAGRMAHFYGTTGSNIATESGCSSSMVAVGLACKSLRRKETSMALACGVNLMLQPSEYEMMAAFCAEDGHCKTFDAAADGFGRAEGCGVLVLKRLSDAVRDGDNIRAVIRGYGEAQEGPSRSLGTPTVDVESLAMTLALQDAEVLPWEVSAVEAHGTGTAVGDPLEMAAIAAVYSRGRRTPLVVTSVKTNVGHTESVSGITGIIKTVLAFARELLPPHRALHNLNPKIDLALTPAAIPLRPTPWPRVPHSPRLAGVSSFGITGTDAHVILQEPPLLPPPRHPPQPPLHLLALSARSEPALTQLIQKYADKLRATDAEWRDVTFTANTGRAHFREFRAAVVAKDVADFQRQVERQTITQHKCPPISEKPKIVFLFTGQGSQYAGMAKELFDTSPDFRRLFNKCDKILLDIYDIDIKRAMWNSDDAELLDETLYSQTAIFVVDFCLAELWKTWGVAPDVVVGHSLGEYAAACVAGILRLEDALKLVAERSRLIDNLPRGKMIVVNVDVDATCRLLRNVGEEVWLDVAAMNSPEQTTLAGTEESVLAFQTFCENNGVKSRVLDATHAFHSQMMDAALPELRKVAQDVNFRRPTCTFVSGMEGGEVTSVDAEFWVRHTRLPVNFVKASDALKGVGGIVCVEVGPAPILSTFVARNFEGHSTSPTLLPSLRRKQSDWRTMTESLGRLYTSGVDVDWSGVHRTAGASKVAGLPTYPFQRRKFWFEKPKSDGLLFSGNQLHPLLHFRLPTATSSKIFQSRLSLDKETYVKDHVVGSHVIFPAAGYVEMILAAGHSATFAEFEEFRFPRQPIFVRDLAVEAPLGMAEKEDVDLQTIVDVATSPEDANWNRVTIHRRQEDAAGTKSWVRHSSAKFSSFCADSAALASPEWVDVERLRESLGAEETAEFYAGLRGVGLNFGESFRSLRRVWRGTESTLAEVVAPPGDAFFAHPVLIDAIIQTLMTSMSTSHDNVTQLMVPVKIDHFAWFPSSEPSTSFFVFVDRNSAEPSAVLLDAGGRRVAVMSGVTLVPTSVVAIENALQAQKLELPPFLEEEWLPTNHRLVGETSTIANNFFDSPAHLKLLELVKDQTSFTEDEKLELALVDQLAALQGLQAFLELGWTSTVGEVVDVRQFVEKLEISPKFLLMTRRIFEILSHHTDFVDGSDFSFQVSKQLPSLSNLEEMILELNESIKHLRVEVECLRSVASKTANVLRGRDSVLPILFGEGRIAEKAYTQFKTTAQGNEFLVHAIKALCDDVKNRGERQRQLRILEVGGGTGGSTRSILPALEESGVDYAYTFTDISAAFFSAAETSFAQWKERMEFRVLDVEKDPKTQGFLHEDFDVVVAAHVLHATRDLKETMANVRHLLRPNGVVLIGETYEPKPFVDMVFGLVDGYWRFDDFDSRPYHCILPGTAWPQLLSSSGFSSQRLLQVPVMNGGAIIAQATSQSFVYSAPASQKMTSWIAVRGSAKDDVALEVTSQLQRQGRRVFLVDDVSDVKWTSELENGRVEGILFVSVRKSFDAEEPTRRFLRLIQSLLSTKVAATPKLVVVTRGAVVVGDQGDAFPHSGTLWGMSKSFRSENSNFRVVNVDLDPHDSSHVNVDTLLRLLWSTKDDFIAVRDQKTFRAKLKWLKIVNTSLTLPQDAKRFALILPTTNLISDLQFGARQRFDVSGNQVEVKVKAAALNFRDLFSVLKPSKEFEKNAAVGTDMAGVVTAVGPDVKELKVGDAVIGCFFQFGGLPSHVVVPADKVARLPHKMTFEDGATIPAVFSTAYHCLVDVARLQKGETVLIHTASGGVGIAAIQVAKDVGARIVATAGSRRKRAFLREVMGIEDVFHSRDLTYREAIVGVTGGRGVDVVLNSLTGPGFKEATLDVCAKGGRFIEMSKLNVWSESDVEALRHDVDYQIVDLMSVSPETWRNLLVKLEELLDSGNFFPLPYEAFESVDVRAALTHLQKARHVGKIVVKMPEDVDVGGGRRHLLFNERSSYLITGGLGGIGLEAAKWMASEGAKFLILAGRRPPNDNANNVIADLNANGKVVLAVQLDVGNFEDCKRLIESINAGNLNLDGSTFPPLRGIQHAAGCLSDGTFPNQTWAKYAETFNGKVRGAWNLHKLTATVALPLEHFVMYSSAVATIGTLGQSNHAAANAFLDALTHFRNARGLPATSVNWGQWGQVGVAADLELNFCTPFTPLQGFSSLRQILRHHKPHVTVMDAKFSKIPLVFPWLSRGYGKCFLASSALPGDKHSVALTSDKFWEEVDAAGGDPKATELVLQRLLTNVVTQMLKLDEGDVIDVDQNLQEMGLDSLMMVELKNVLQSVLGSKVTLTAAALADANSIRKLAKKLRQMILEGDELSTEEKVDFILSQSKLDDVISADKADLIGDLGSEHVTLLLSGAVDSQLATSILENLTRMSNVRKVVVLSAEDAKKALLSQLNGEDVQIDVSKCEVISTDEDFPEKLGIPQEQFEQLASEVDAVVDIRLTSPDESVPGIRMETQTTKALLEFACNKKLKFVCHVNRLLPQRKATEQRVLEETLPCGRREELARYADSGYSSSQFVSECLLAEAAGRGVPCRVFRVPHLSGHSQTGRFQLDEGHIFTRYLQFLRLGKMPSVPVPFALVPVDQAAALLLQVLWSTSTAEGSLRVFNLSNPHEYSLSDFVEVSGELGRPVRAVELEEFLADNKNSLVETVTFSFGDPLDFSGNSSYSQLAKAAGEEQIPLGNLRRVVADFAGQVETPPGILRRDLTFAQNSGLFQKFLLPSDSPNKDDVQPPH